jgi:putative acetyltransferase
MMMIRKSEMNDGPRIMQIWRDAVDATHDFLSAEDRREIEQEVAGFLPSAPLWLAVDGSNGPVGFMLLDGAHMEALFIDPAIRGRGVGKALVEHACSLHPVIYTDVNEQNAQAVGFYSHLGFAQTGRSEVDGQGRPNP